MARTLFILQVFLLLIFPASCAKKASIENVVLISLDTTRADHVDSGRGARARTPELRRFASQAIVFDNAFCTIPQTLPSHLSIFSGRDPHELGVFGNEYVYDGRYPLLAEVLKEKGWRTTAVVSLGTVAASCGINRGFESYFDHLSEATQFFAPAAKVTDTALSLLERLKKEKFFLFVHYSDPHPPYAPPAAKADFCISLDDRPLTTFNAYSGAILRLKIPLRPGTHRLHLAVSALPGIFDSFVIRRLETRPASRITLENISFTKALYNGSHILSGHEGSVTLLCPKACELKIFQIIPQLGLSATLENYRLEVEYLDAQVGRLLQRLAAEKLLEKTAVVIFADHGEGLGERERYVGHVRFLNRPSIHVPLFVRLPGVDHGRIKTPVSLKGIAPTLLALLSIASPSFSSSLNLLPARGAKHSLPETIASFTFTPAAEVDRCSLIRWPWQLIINRASPPDDEETREYYDLRFGASRKLEAIAPEVIRENDPSAFGCFERLRPLWQAAFLRRKRFPPNAKAAQLDKLKTLGYIRQP